MAHQTSSGWAPPRLAPQPDEHVDDGDGICRGCTEWNYHQKVKFPCAYALDGNEAARVYEQSRAKVADFEASGLSVKDWYAQRNRTRKGRQWI